MKTIKLITIFVLLAGIIAVPSKAQSFKYLVDTTATWNVAHTYPNASPQFPAFRETKTTTYGFRGDTLINSERWFKFYQSQDSLLRPPLRFLGLLREAGKRVLFIDTNGLKDTLYDFSLQLGNKVVYSLHTFPDTIEVKKIDSVLMEGHYRRRLHFSEPAAILPDIFNQVWIEGIGSVHYPLNPKFIEADTPIFDDTTRVTCFKKKDTVVWRNLFYQNCIVNNILSTDESPLPEGGYHLYPNPARDRFTLESRDNEPLERVVIYNVMGQAVRTFDNPGRTIEIQDLPPGNYFLEVHGNESIAHLPLLVE